MAIDWKTISGEHQEKLKRLAIRQGITCDTAIKRIVSYIQNNNLYLARPDYFNIFISGKDSGISPDVIASLIKRMGVL